MRAAFSAILLLMLWAPALLKFSIVVWYASNIDYVATRLCENRNRPERHCNGKCYLYKQLAKADGADKNNRQRLADLSRIELSAFVMPEALQLRMHIPEEAPCWAAYQSPFAEAVSLHIFHPPG
jgi:hypothetical protein